MPMLPSSSRGWAFQTRDLHATLASQNLRTQPSRGLPERSEARRGQQGPIRQADEKTVDKKQEARAIRRTTRGWQLPPQKERLAWPDGVGEVPSIEVGTGH